HGPRLVALHPAPQLLRRRVRVVGHLAHGLDRALGGHPHLLRARPDDVHPPASHRQAPARAPPHPQPARVRRLHRAHERLHPPSPQERDMSQPTFVLGGYQTDFAENWTAKDKGIYDLVAAAVTGALEATDVPPADIDVAHVGNMAGELFCGQAHLGGMVATVDPAFASLPTARHEAACASGSVAALAGMADLEAGRYDCALVVGVELMRNVGAQEAAEHLGSAAWAGREA